MERPLSWQICQRLKCCVELQRVVHGFVAPSHSLLPFWHIYYLAKVMLPGCLWVWCPLQCHGWYWLPVLLSHTLHLPLTVEKIFPHFSVLKVCHSNTSIFIENASCIVKYRLFSLVVHTCTHTHICLNIASKLFWDILWFMCWQSTCDSTSHLNDLDLDLTSSQSGVE